MAAPGTDLYREKAKPIASPSGRSAIWRSLVDLKVASILLSIHRILSTARGAVLEVGCGNQPYRFLFKDVVYRAIDHSRSEQFTFVRKPDVTYFDGSIFPVDDSSHDLVFHSEVLEHVEDPEFFLKECHRILRPRGCLVFTAPLNFRFHYIPYDYFRFTPSGLRLLLTKAGFGDIEITPQGTDITTVCHKILCLFFRWLREDVGVLLRASRLVLTLLCLPFLAGVHLTGLLSLLGIGSSDDPLGYRVVAYK